MFDVWHVLGNNDSRYLFQIFFIRGKKEAFDVCVVLGRMHFKIFVVLRDVVFFDQLKM